MPDDRSDTRPVHHPDPRQPEGAPGTWPRIRAEDVMEARRRQLRGDDAPASRPDRPAAAASRIPGPAALWVLAAIVIFGLAVGLAFAVNGGGDGAATAAPADPSSETPAASATDAGSTDVATDGAPASPDSAATADATPPTAVADAQTAASADTATPATDTPATDPPAAGAEANGPAAGTAALDPLTGFVLPIAAVCLPEFEGHLPNAPRDYRDGIHEGVDFYTWAACTPIDENTPILAAKAGVIVRIDHQYTDLTAEEYTAMGEANYVGEAILDRLRGRQVWVDHGGGIVTRYAHLGAVASGREVGDAVAAGALLGFAGESGTPESFVNPGSDEHLHFEIRVGDGYLGAGQDPLAARAGYLHAFGLDAAGDAGE